jgi:L-methionine (R)-S-oxide reductase
MDNSDDPRSGVLAKLQDLSGFLETQGSLDDNLQQLASTAARILNAENCSIMLIKDEAEDGTFSLRVCANHGNLPAKAYREAVKVGDGIAGRVVAKGKSMLVENIDASEFAQLARQTHDPRKSMISSPILVNGKIIGVININGPKRNRPFNLDDLGLLDIVALFVGKSIQVVQLQNLLRSRFAQLAIAHNTEKAIGDVLINTAQNPDQMAKIVAKSFYREMTKAGFGSGQIINAASEIISQLSSSLQKHSERAHRAKNEEKAAVKSTERKTGAQRRNAH